MINPISDSSFVKYLEYIDDVVKVNIGRRRNILNKKKKQLNYIKILYQINEQLNIHEDKAKPRV